MKGRITIVNGAGYTAKQLAEATRKALGETAILWWRVYLPEHFEMTANQKYGYQPRKGDNEPPMVPSKKKASRMVRNNAYSWRKRRTKRHNLPLVYTGLTRRMATTSYRDPKFSQPRKSGLIRCRLPIPVPEYFYRYRKDLGQPDKYAELTRTTPAEREYLLGHHNRRVLFHLAAMPRKTEKIGV